MSFGPPADLDTYLSNFPDYGRSLSEFGRGGGINPQVMCNPHTEPNVPQDYDEHDTYMPMAEATALYEDEEMGTSSSSNNPSDQDSPLHAFLAHGNQPATPRRTSSEEYEWHSEYPAHTETKVFPGTTNSPPQAEISSPTEQSSTYDCSAQEELFKLVNLSNDHSSNPVKRKRESKNKEQRKQKHIVSEQRRRKDMNQAITTLKELLPPKERQKNTTKLAVLKEAAICMKRLQEVGTDLIAKKRDLEAENRDMQEKINGLTSQVQLLQSQLQAQHSISPPQPRHSMQAIPQVKQPEAFSSHPYPQSMPSVHNSIPIPMARQQAIWPPSMDMSTTHQRHVIPPSYIYQQQPITNPVHPSQLQSRKRGHEEMSASSAYAYGWPKQAASKFVFVAVFFVFCVAQQHLPLHESHSTGSSRVLLDWQDVQTFNAAVLDFIFAPVVQLIVKWFAFFVVLYTALVMWRPRHDCEQIGKAKASQKSSAEYFKNGNLRKAEQECRTSLLFLGKPIPSSSLRLRLGIALECIRHFLHFIFLGCWVEQVLHWLTNEASQSTLEGQSLCEFLRYHDKFDAEWIWAALRGLNLAQATGNYRDQAEICVACNLRAKSSHGAASLLVRWYTTFKLWRVQLASPAGKEELGIAYFEEGLEKICNGKLVEATRAIQDSIKLFGEAKQETRATSANIVLGLNYALQANFEASKTFFYQALKDSSERVDENNVRACLLGFAHLYVEMGDISSAEQVLNAIDHRFVLADTTDRILFDSLKCYVALRTKKYDESIQLAKAVARDIKNSKPIQRHTQFKTYLAYQVLSDAIIGLMSVSLQEESLKVHAEELQAVAKNHLKAFHVFSKTIPIANACLLRCQGLYLYHTENSLEEASPFWNKSLEKSKLCGLKVEEMKAETEMHLQQEV